MKVFFYLPDFRGGGAERVMIEIARFMDASDAYHVELIVGMNQGALSEYVQDLGIPIHTLNAFHAKKAMIPLIRRLRRSLPDVVIATLGASVALVLSRLFIPKDILIITRLGNTVSAEAQIISNPFRRKLYLVLNRFVTTHSHLVIVQSEHMRMDALQRLGVEHAKTKVIYNPVRASVACTLPSASLKTSWDFVSAGRLVPQKNFLYLLKGLKLLQKYGKYPKLLLMGEGPEREALKNFIAEESMEGQVKMPGYVPSPMNEIAASRIAVLPSLYEGCSNFLVDALALGVPVLASDCPGANRELINEKNGWLFELGSTEVLGDSMLKALGEADHLDREEIRSGARQRFSLARIGRQYADVIREVRS